MSDFKEVMFFMYEHVSFYAKNLKYYDLFSELFETEVLWHNFHVGRYGIVKLCFHHQYNHRLH